MSDTPISTLHAAPAESASPMPALRKAGWAFMLQNPLHWMAMGFGSGLSPKAPGTVGTLWAWVAYLVLQLWLSPQAIGILIAVSIPLGWWACTATARNMGIADPGSIVWDEIVAFWIILWLVMPAGFWGQLIAFALFRYFDAAKPQPVRWADRCFKGFGWGGGWGIMWDDLVAAFCTLLVIALWRHFV
jgi:phosphatidylglycerophosphatase A